MMAVLFQNVWPESVVPVAHTGFWPMALIIAATHEGP